LKALPLSYNNSVKRLLAQFMLGAVILVNLQCALVFLIWPGSYVGAFELTRPVGEAMLRGMGVWFLMWNVPYIVALWNPIRHRLALYESLAMQAIGLLGETAIYASLPAVHAVAQASIARFITFDTLGLLALITAAWVSRDSFDKIHIF
jgi:hypothetical protein